MFGRLPVAAQGQATAPVAQQVSAAFTLLSRSPAHTGAAPRSSSGAGCVAGQLAGVEALSPPAFVSPGLSSLARQLPRLVLLTSLAGAFYSPAYAETWSAGRGASSVELRSTDIPGAVAELHFNNTSNDSGTRLTYDWQLTHDGLTVRGQVDLGTGDADTIHVEVPEGFVAYPDTETIPDGSAATIFIYPLNAVGM